MGHVRGGHSKLSKVIRSLIDNAISGKRAGVGLNIARDIVVGAFGGTLHHEPTPGGDATFVVSLPRLANED